jgi:hypothetical protein
MSTSQKTFNQVKGILGKLDQRIDSLRAARTNDRLIGASPAATPVLPANGPATIPMNTTIGTGSLPKPAVLPVAPAPAAPLPARNSLYGRATPIRPTGT